MTVLMKAFWPFVNEVLCERCRQPVKTTEGVGVWVGDKPSGLAHETCPESGDIGDAAT